MSYSKLHSSIVNSSLWTENDSVRLLFITLLATCDMEGIVYGSKYGLARIANIDPDEMDAAWKTLMSPDPDSTDRMRSPEFEGRRVEEVVGGFKLLNFEYYRGLRNEDDRRRQNREAQARFKEKKAKLSQPKPDSAEVSQAQPAKAHTESDAEAEAEKTPLPPKGEKAVLSPFTSDEFNAAWQSWVEYKRERKQKLPLSTIKCQFRELAKMGEKAAIQSIEQSITQGWTGLFAPKPANGAKAVIRKERRISADHPDEVPDHLRNP